MRPKLKKKQTKPILFFSVFINFNVELHSHFKPFVSQSVTQIPKLISSVGSDHTIYVERKIVSGEQKLPLIIALYALL